jgi:hypothetical protein
MQTKTRKAKQPRPGYWRENQTRWHEQTLVYCNSCGVLIPKKQWVVEQGKEQRVFCTEVCAALYQRYRRRVSDWTACLYDSGVKKSRVWGLELLVGSPSSFPSAQMTPRNSEATPWD